MSKNYDPKWSIWLSVDPMAEKYAGWSPYNYTTNNPINMIDPDGRDIIPVHGTWANILT
ncbi:MULTISPECIES: RHS repeat-associated core domain-containing protein [Mesonia]|uniref:RHS repeat-associated core domain-containing protein n=1 Tax=Mesonia TaxID=232115 RepID=UPI00124302D6|nr:MULTISPECIES: RHS repeat-associated core domain-containing protein [Mesonia]